MIGTVLSGRYKLEAKLGSGGMSTVYLARDTTLDRQVAVKVMHREMSEQADQLERFRQEARAVAKLSHPNVVAVIDAGEDGGHPYIVFEYVEGETLKQRINRVRTPKVASAAPSARSCCGRPRSTSSRSSPCSAPRSTSAASPTSPPAAPRTCSASVPRSATRSTTRFPSRPSST